jgi:transposase-like protein
MLKQRNRYSAEFKAEAVELVRIGKPVAEVAEELACPPKTGQLKKEVLRVKKADSARSKK